MPHGALTSPRRHELPSLPATPPCPSVLNPPSLLQIPLHPNTCLPKYVRYASLWAEALSCNSLAPPCIQPVAAVNRQQPPGSGPHQAGGWASGPPAAAVAASCCAHGRCCMPGGAGRATGGGSALGRSWQARRLGSRWETGRLTQQHCCVLRRACTAGDHQNVAAGSCRWQRRQPPCNSQLPCRGGGPAPRGAACCGAASVADLPASSQPSQRMKGIYKAQPLLQQPCVRLRDNGKGLH